MSVLRSANEEDVYFNFINSLKSDVTKKTYEREIKKFMALCDIETDLLKIDPQKQIVKYLKSEREKGYHSIQLNLILMQFTLFTKLMTFRLNKKKINVLYVICLPI